MHCPVCKSAIVVTEDKHDEYDVDSTGALVLNERFSCIERKIFCPECGDLADYFLVTGNRVHPVN